MADAPEKQDNTKKFKAFSIVKLNFDDMTRAGREKELEHIMAPI